MSGLTTLAGIVVLTGARNINTTKGNRDLYLNANIYVDDNYKDNPSTGLVHFFNHADIPFNIEPLYVMAAMHVKTPPSLPPQVLPEKFTLCDYAFIGEVNHLALLPAFPETDPCQRSYITASGIVSTADTNNRQFTIKCDQYLSLIKRVVPCTLSCTIPSTPRWEKTHIPQPNTPLTVSGTFDRINRNNDQVTTSFSITIDSLAFSPRGSIIQTTTTGPSSGSTKTGFSYAEMKKKRKHTDKE
ncbi:hypothetical protein AGABI1DRAFT_130645 [Agaricus bisporus var. burnettii JB137-S8]|uniref:Uncharacterized protein n=1 Tax=Agaricus bisporus var. burnettii (strain JB137-S8 / ATCC MYA-4627 / FGSC 10392) TaxID=597362 RepID=K5X261_AGABU|nr:uncharacterized protein AGABI1DRAFT_130645 [Agaricus bisporus var. burnettii JB137-S8]EKM77228.1 hypothetical protein AGABI1DRAFT_130645 [Agaricus bisporus var. burnettii JB137-S8]